jgi:hypothetical protein
VPILRGLIRNPLLRHPLLQRVCSLCGRIRTLTRQYRSNLGCRLAILSYLKKADDAPNQKHDPPEYFRDQESKISPLSAEDKVKLRGRNRQSFAVPHCDVEECPRLVKPMERSSESSHNRLRHTNDVLSTCNSVDVGPPHLAYRCTLLD